MNAFGTKPGALPGTAGRRGLGLDFGLYILSTAILVITVLLPVLMIAYNTFIDGGRLDWRMFVRVVGDPGNLKSVWNTVVIALWVTVLGTVLGIFYAWLIGRSDIPLKGLMKSLFTIPYMFPPFFGAMAWSLLLAPRSGYINRLFMDLTGGTTPLFNMHSIAGIVFVETCYYFPFVFLQVVSALERMDPTLEESARIAGAGQWYVIRRITLPLVLPAIAAGAMLILISSLSHFGVPAILGFSQNIFTLPTKIYQLIRRSAGSFQGIREAAALSILLIVVVVAALYVQKRVLKTGRYDIIKGKSMRPMLIKLRGARLPILAVCLASLGVIVVLPLAVVILVGFLKAYGLPFRFENFTIRNYQYVLFRSRMVIDSIRNSLFLSVASGVITMFLGVMVAYVVVKVKPRGKGLLEILSLLPYSMPGIVLAIGVILVWSGAFYLNLYNTIWIILIAYIARYVSFAMKSASASLEQVHYSLEEAARSCGATHLESLRDVTLPLIRPGMVAGFFLIFLPGMRELTTSVLLYGPFTRTLGVAIYSMNAEGNTVQSSALATIAIGIILAGNLALRWVTKDRKGA
ncbi:MAG TPA: iron ABC transporter permease [Spirochaetia bacterium]|nr:iron ABC transporter permease [Spirochaetales bacterium]HRY80499.1 iron ABC transporter permease [Spirochaetia bacterium]HRZ88481.1 iron ABC transporter permease [Spirochaetia bacterium]